MAALKRIAFFGVGMIATGTNSRGIPSLDLLMRNLSSHYEVIVYRLTPGDSPNTSLYRLRSVSNWSLPRKIQYSIIVFYFLMDHLRFRFSVINALAATPAGRVAVWLGKMFGIPVVVHLHAAEAVAFPDFNHGDLLNPVLKKIIKKVCAQADVTTVLSNFQKQLVHRNLLLSKESVVIPRGIDVEKFLFSERRTEKILKILFIGYNQPVKDASGAIEVFAHVNQEIDSTLTMIGADLTYSTFENQLKRLNIQDKVVFLGTVPFDRMRNVYESTDILLVTSRYESQSSVAMEAMASGVLVCGTRVGILADLSGSACVTVEVEDYEGLANYILQLWHEPDRQKQLRLNARGWAEDHDANWTAVQYRYLFESLFNKR